MVIGGGKKAPMKKSKSLSIDKVWVPKNPKVYQLIKFWPQKTKSLSIDKLLVPSSLHPAAHTNSQVGGIPAAVFSFAAGPGARQSAHLPSGLLLLCLVRLCWRCLWSRL